jgi:hypothetical protein
METTECVRFGLSCSQNSSGTASLTLNKLYVLPTQRIYVFCVDLRTNSDYLPIQR